MKKILTNILIFCLMINIAQAQYQLEYEEFSIGSQGDTAHTTVLQKNGQLKIFSADPTTENPIPGTATTYLYIDYNQDTIIQQLYYNEDESYCTGHSIRKSLKIEEQTNENLNGYNCTKYTFTSFSNRLEVWMTDDLKIDATPLPFVAELPGTMVQFLQNGSACIQLKSIKKNKKLEDLFPSNFGKPLSGRELSNLKKEKLVLTYPIFDSAQICFNPGIVKPKEVPYDTTLVFSNGTVILKKIKMPVLPSHYQVFAELTEYSNGDAYDRTGSVFVIPMSEKQNFLQALTDSINRVPYFTNKKGKKFQGMVKTDQYLPLVELIRFFTPFGVRQYNEYRSVDGLEWAEEVQYKQEITDLMPLMNGDVYIGIFIGNYDHGGHIVSLDLKAHPQTDSWDIADSEDFIVMPLFNTCNVMEMDGQTYSTFFRTDSLNVTFTVPENVESLRLRYITTGHGGWDEGDEFVPKTNHILIDGQQQFSYTPWRSDCGTYRAYNPASGNFWNGVSSSDYSRSGWCPGTAAQPVYFDLSGLSAGEHTMTIAIPQGKPEGNSFSSWNVSGVLVGKLHNTHN